MKIRETYQIIALMQKGEIMNPNYIVKQTLKNGGFTPDNLKDRYIVETPSNETIKPFAKLSNQLAIYDRLENKEIIL